MWKIFLCCKNLGPIVLAVEISHVLSLHIIKLLIFIYIYVEIGGGKVTGK